MKKPKATPKKPVIDDVVVHEFRPLPDRTPVEQVKALTQIVHQMSQTNFEVRLEMNDLREKNIELNAEVNYLRSIVDASGKKNYLNLFKN